MFATLLDMITRFGADELIQLSNRANVLPTPEMLALAAEDGDLSGFSEDEQAATFAVAAAVDEAIKDAAGEINPFLQSRYQLPLASVPRVLVKAACDMARYHLHSGDVPDPVRNRYKDSLAFLRSVANGQADLGLDANQEATAPVGGVQYAATDRVFTNDNLSTFLG